MFEYKGLSTRNVFLVKFFTKSFIVTLDQFSGSFSNLIKINSLANLCQFWNYSQKLIASCKNLKFASWENCHLAPLQDPPVHFPSILSELPYWKRKSLEYKTYKTRHVFVWLSELQAGLNVTPPAYFPYEWTLQHALDVIFPRFSSTCNSFLFTVCFFSPFSEADYTLDESFWKEEDSPVGKCCKINGIAWLRARVNHRLSTCYFNNLSLTELLSETPEGRAAATAGHVFGTVRACRFPGRED